MWVRQTMLRVELCFCGFTTIVRTGVSPRKLPRMAPGQGVTSSPEPVVPAPRDHGNLSSNLL